MTKANTTLDQIRFTPTEKNLFFPTLRKRVDQYFMDHKISRNANGEMVMKTIILICGYILPFVAILVFGITGPMGYFLWAFMGFCVAGI
jgi:linoleoyl-CoA desaturase